ncbi:DsbE family thiol:disulfide interchange protein [Cereibacter sphaeroides]|uniref:DsbE family thiol:disulfide interchange protein n=1 Tax=Cereibacter sphaeroides TaxID=1063 RepID=UPI001F1F149D|nr:DsbE family thiol:disulfide interchange protein [Cereibacter sphaeroides]MCE6951558.1 DsbE family thiol:disulfide interchange protein [Cereibacter sphaeroides]MCE6959007.1 DsbE family thiol:disulfide interchange protein [Cereibacter sphaeroides]MCE6969071.1 DsbE family thiol:disulfide interchange protein [Cereibacter sphaeroides]MCE6973651.1 DsbE family thiol:disulfide interchange protein [Cereibacter sphaeroides]
MAKALMFVPPVLFAGLAVMFFVGMQRENPDELPSALAGKPAPAVRVTPLGEGQPFTDATLREPGVKLVNYWASWCAPCRAEAPSLEKLAAEGVAIHGVNYKDKPGNALAFLDEVGNPYRLMGADESGRMALDWGVYGVPETYVIDGEGRIVLRFAGPVTERTLEDTIRPAMARAAAAR